MKNKATQTLKAKGQSEQSAFGVNYRWTDGDGVICSGHTVATGRDRAHAERRFFRQNRHVQMEEVER